METSLFSKGALLVAWYVVFLFSLVLHEAAHALAAKLGGDETAARGGQVSIDPSPHIRREPLGTVVVPIVSFLVSGWMMGWASAPYDQIWADRYPHRAARMALAGPAANFFLALLAGITMAVGLKLGWFVVPHYPPEGILYSDLFWGLVRPAPGTPGIFATLLSITLSLNLLLFIFNMLPFPPLDGSGVAGLFLNEEGARRLQSLMRHPTLSFLGIFAAWKLIDLIFIPFFDKAIDLIYEPSALFYLLIFFSVTTLPLLGFLVIREKWSRKRLELLNIAPANEAVFKKGNEDAASPDSDAIVALCDAACRGDIEPAKRLMQADSMLFNKKNSEGQSPIHFAAAGGSLRMMKLLVSRHASINTIDSKGATPLHYAALKGNLEAAEFLIEKGAEVNMKSGSDGSTPLHCAAVGGSKDVAGLLISRGAEIEAKKTDGQTPLHRASSNGHAELIEVLISKGALINAADEAGRTPLHCAAIQGHREAALMLLAGGASTEAVDSGGLTPLKLAAKNGHHEIEKILTERE